MSDTSTPQLVSRKKRKFYTMSQSMSKNPPGLKLENAADVNPPGRKFFTHPDIRQRGFSGHPPGMRPHLRHRKKDGRKPLDLEAFEYYWLITDRTKAVFEQVDPTAFEFVECDLTFDDGSPPARAWICDVIRVLDVLDEEQSDVKIIEDNDRRRYYLGGSTHLRFKSDSVGSAHIFRMFYAEYIVICDEQMRESCKSARLRSLTFHDAIQKAR